MAVRWRGDGEAHGMPNDFAVPEDETRCFVCFTRGCCKTTLREVECASFLCEVERADETRCCVCSSWKGYTFPGKEYVLSKFLKINGLPTLLKKSVSPAEPGGHQIATKLPPLTLPLK